MDFDKFVNDVREHFKCYIQKYKLESVIIGVSGGIDSTVSCALASPVCQELDIPLIGRSLPTNSNKVYEIITAQSVGEAFCTDFKEVSILSISDYVTQELQINEGYLTNLQKGNIKARLRMIYLRNLAALHKGIVLDNDNFTEWNLGFWTIEGDSPMDYNIGLHYLWKTEVYKLAEHLAQQYLDKFSKGHDSCNLLKHEAIKDSMDLVPTDGNGVSKSDCEQFGLGNYYQVDDVLYTMYYRNGLEGAFSSDEDQYKRLIEYYGKEGVDKVIALHDSTTYKRTAPPAMPPASIISKSHEISD